MKQDNASQMDTTNYMQILTLANKVFSEWEGKVVEEKNKISLISNNQLGSKKVECKVSMGLLNCKDYPFCVDAEEKTCSILGGCGCPCENIEEVEKEVRILLKRYNFEEKRQMSIFSLFDL